MAEWLLKNRVLMSTCAPHKHLDSVLIDWDKLWENNKEALAAQWTSSFDINVITPWWYCILDKSVTIDSMNSKNRYEVKKGMKSYFARRIIDTNEAYTMAHITIEEWKNYEENYRPKKTIENLVKNYESLILKEGHEIWGCYEKESNILVGFAHLFIHDDWIDFMSMKMNKNHQKRNATYVLVYSISNSYDVGTCSKIKYISDGRRNVVHHTNFQDYLVSHFGWRYAYAKLNIKYRPGFYIVVKILYPMKSWFASWHNEIGKKISIMLEYEEIARECKKVNVNE